jgi:integrase
MNRLLSEVERGTHVDRSLLTVGDYLVRWLDGLAIAGLEETTIADYR